MLVAATMTVAEVQKTIMHADKRIKSVALIDFFEKPEWHEQRSLTFRFIVADEQKTMTKQEIDDVWEHVVRSVQQQGVEIR